MDRFDSAQIRLISDYMKRVKTILGTFQNECIYLAKTVGFDPATPFSFADYPVTDVHVRKLMDTMRANLQGTVENGVTDAWQMANAKNNALVHSTLSVKALEGMNAEMVRRYFNEHRGALEAFKSRTTAGMDLSTRVWNITEQSRTELESAIDIALRDGASAQSLSRDVRKFLNDPQRLFRRVRDEHGVLHLSKAAKAFHPGQGVYRSSYKNAMRLAGTEINIAYRTADHLRYQELDFVVGILIALSPTNHPEVDICDELKGKYPKDFKFTGWHPNCRCHVETILKTPEEMDDDDARIASGGEPSAHSVNEVKEMPEQFNKWLANNSTRLDTAKQLPYFITDNYSYVRDAGGALRFTRITAAPKPPTLLELAEQRHKQRTPEQIAAIQARATARATANTAYDELMAEYGHLGAEIDLTPAGFTPNYDDWKRNVDKIRGDIDNRFAAFKRITDAKARSHSYPLAELEAAEKAIENTLSRMGYDTLTADQRVSKMAFERDYIDKHRKYSTWEVVRDTYDRMMKESEQVLIYEKRKDTYRELEKFATTHKSKELKDTVDKLFSELWSSATPDLGKVDALIAKAEEKRHRLELADAWRARKRAAKAGGTPVDISGIPTLTQLQETIDNYKKNSYHYGTEARTYQNEGKEVMKRLFEKHSYGMNIKDFLLEKVYKSHFKNTFETGSSGGYKGSSKTTGKIELGHGRLHASHHMFMNDRKLSNQLERSQYEKYGSLLDSDIEKSLSSYNPARQYGNVEVRFKKDKVTCTWTARDSLCEYYQPSLVSEPDMASFDKLSVPKDRNMVIGDMDDFRNRYTGGSYLELQYHGDVTIDCIESIAFPYDITELRYIDMAGIATKFNDRGINIFYMKGGRLQRFGRAY